MYNLYKCSYDNNVELKIPIYLGKNSEKKKMYNFYKDGSLFLREQKKRQIISNLINKKLIDKNQNIIDAGAFLGDTSLPLSLNIEGFMYSIDPGTINIKIIQEIIDLNNIKNIKILPYCLSDKNKKLYYNKGEYGLNFASFRDNQTNMDYSIDSYSLDILCNKHIIENISFIHIGIEGQEFSVIKGSINIIKKYNPLIIFEGHIKSGSANVISCCVFLKNLNYNIFMINEDAGNPGDCRNFLCIPNNKLTNFNKNFDFMEYIINVNNQYISDTNINQQCILNTNIYLLPQKYKILGKGYSNIIDYIEIGTCFWDSWCYEKPDLKGIVIEPIKFYLDKLLSNERCIRNNLIIENCAISNYNGESTMYWIPPYIIDKNGINDCLKGMNKLGDYHPGHLTRKDLTQEISCVVTTLNNLLKKHSIKYFDYLKIDTEGHDCIILNDMINTYENNFILPRFILFENNACTEKYIIDNTINNLFKHGYEHIFTQEDNTYMYNCRTYYELNKLENNILQNRDKNICTKKIFIEDVHKHYIEYAFKELFRIYNFNIVEKPELSDIIITSQDINSIKKFKNIYPNKIIVSQIHGGGIGSIKLLKKHYPNIPIICKSFTDYHYFSKKKVLLSIGKYEKFTKYFQKIFNYRLNNIDLTINNFLNLCSSLAWNPPAIRNCYFNLKDKWNIYTFGPDSPQGMKETLCDNFIDSPLSQYKFYLHLKNIGYLCNSVIQAIMCGIPVIMSRQNYKETLYSQFVPNEIIIFIENHHAHCLQEKEVEAALKIASSLSNDEYLELSHKTYLSGSFFRQYYPNEIEEMNAFLNNL